MAPLHTLTAVQLASLIQGRQVSCREVVDAHLARIQETNTALNALTVVLADEARADADRADRATSRGPLHGVPFTIKENIDVLGSASTHGLRLGPRSLPYLDAPVVHRLKAAGAIPIGRGNLSELAMRMDTDNPLRGRTRNPWRPSLSCGGSSGGDAVAVAAGMTPLGLGNDMGGSLRVPAHACGVATLKPTTGRFPYANSLEPQDLGFSGQAMAVPGPLARSVEDLALCLRVLAGRDVRDPRSVDAPLVGPRPTKLRAALVTQLHGTPLLDVHRAPVLRAGELLSKAGWTVEEATPPETDRACEVWHLITATDLAAMIPLVTRAISTELDGHLRRILKSAHLERASNHRIHTERSRLGRAWSGFFQEYPVCIGPNLTAPLWAPDADLDPSTGLDMLMEATRFILPANALGLPVVALPMGVVDGLPTSVQVYADLWREDLCLEAAAVVEAGVGRPGLALP
jgi:amidase